MDCPAGPMSALGGSGCAAPKEEVRVYPYRTLGACLRSFLEAHCQVAGTPTTHPTVVIEMATLLREEGEELSVCQARPIEEELHLVEKLDPVLFQQHEMGSLAK